MFVLTRWIGPHAYGLFVTAVGLSSFLAALTRGGIDTYLVRAESPPERRAYDIATTLILMFSLLLVLGGAAAVPLLARWYGNREFVAAYLATLLVVPLAGLAGPATAKLERELNFRAVAGIELTGQILASIVSITLAWRGLGLWAPVFGQLSWQIWAAGGPMWTAKLLPRPAFDAREARKMLSFGIGYSASLRVWQLRALINPLLVGRFAGAEGVAFVALAIRIAEGLGFVRIAAGRLALAALSRVRHDRRHFQELLEGALRFQVMVLGLLLCFFALVAPIVLPRLIGVSWLPSLHLYPFVAAGVLANSVYNLQASALFVAGRQWIVLRAYVLHVALLGFATIAMVPSLGIRGYGWAEIAACGGYVILHAGTRQLARISYRKLAGMVFAFLLPPFALLLQSPWSLLLWTPLVILIVLEIWKPDLNAQPVPSGLPSFRSIPILSLMRPRISDERS